MHHRLHAFPILHIKSLHITLHYTHHILNLIDFGDTLFIYMHSLFLLLTYCLYYSYKAMRHLRIIGHTVSPCGVDVYLTIKPSSLENHLIILDTIQCFTTYLAKPFVRSHTKAMLQYTVHLINTS